MAKSAPADSVILGRSSAITSEGNAMDAVWVGIVVTIITFLGGVLGLTLQTRLPDEHSVEKSRDMISAVMGLVTLLLALVLGTIVGSAYFFSATQQSELQGLSAQAIQLDEALAQFGPDAKPLRDKYKESLDKNLKLFWGGGDVDPGELHVSKAMATMSALRGAIRALDAKTPEQKDAVAAANSHLGQLEQTRLLMSLQLANPYSKPLLIVVVFWSFFLFCGFGLMSRLNVTTLAALAFGAFAVGSAIFLILELSQPYTGLFRISPAALQQTIDSIDK
jgi:Protein of unknown function (DUF4239)